LTVLPVVFALAATAHADDQQDRVIGGLPTAQGSDLRPETIIGGVGPATAPAGERGADPGPRPVVLPSPEQPPASTGGADLGADAGGRLTRSVEGSGAATKARDAHKTVAAQLTQTRRRGMKAARDTASAAIDYLRAQVAGAIRRLDESLPLVGPERKSPADTKRKGTTGPAAGTKALAGGDTRLARGEPGPPSGGVRPVAEASTDQLTAGADRPQGEHSVSSSVNPEPVSGLGSTAQILVPIGLAAAVCGLGTPAIRRRLDPRAGWLRSALLASSLEQPG
jgi:hypothetical protein